MGVKAFSCHLGLSGDIRAVRFCRKSVWSRDQPADRPAKPADPALPDRLQLPIVCGGRAEGAARHHDGNSGHVITRQTRDHTGRHVMMMVTILLLTFQKQTCIE